MGGNDTGGVYFKFMVAFYQTVIVQITSVFTIMSNLLRDTSYGSVPARERCVGLVFYIFLNIDVLKYMGCYTALQGTLFKAHVTLAGADGMCTK